MGMSKCYSLMKCLLIIFNIIFLVVGGAACAACAWALYEGRAGEAAAARAGLCALCAWAAALAAAALAALAGALRHSASLLAAAFALLALCGAAEGGAAWWGAAHAPELRAALRASLARAVRSEYGSVASRTAALDAIQRGLRCCGEAGVRDWQASAWARAQDGPHSPASAGTGQDALDLSVRAPPQYYVVPESCCVERGAACEAARRVPAASKGAPGGYILELSVRAPPQYYVVPESCCVERGAACEAARRVPAASKGAPGLHGAACGARVPAALAAAARGPLLAGAVLLAMHAAALLLTLALCLRAHPRPHYKA